MVSNFKLFVAESDPSEGHVHRVRAVDNIDAFSSSLLGVQPHPKGPKAIIKHLGVISDPNKLWPSPNAVNINGCQPTAFPPYISGASMILCSLSEELEAEYEAMQPDVDSIK